MSPKDEVSLHVDKDQLEKIEKAKLKKKEREEERVRNLEALEKHLEEEKKRKKKEAEPKKKEEPEIDGPVKTISLAILIIATVFGGLASVGMVAAEIYLVYHFDLCFVCYIIIVIQVIAIVAGTISRWVDWYLKTKHVKMGQD